MPLVLNGPPSNVRFQPYTDTTNISYLHQGYHTPDQIRDIQIMCPTTQRMALWWGLIYVNDNWHQLGEGFGHTLKRAIKYASRVTKTPYKDNLKKVPILVEQQVVILEVHLPEDFIENKNNIGSATEIYTTGKVPVEFIHKVIFLQ